MPTPSPLEVLRELRHATLAWRTAAYDACPTLVVSNEAVNRLSVALFMAERAIAAADRKEG